MSESRLVLTPLDLKDAPELPILLCDRNKSSYLTHVKHPWRPDWTPRIDRSMVLSFLGNVAKTTSYYCHAAQVETGASAFPKRRIINSLALDTFECQDPYW